MDKALQMLSLARRAGKLALGFDAVTAAVERRQAVLVLLSETLAERTRRNILRITQNTARLVPYPPETLKPFVGKEVGVVAVLDENLAKAVDKALPQPPAAV